MSCKSTSYARQMGCLAVFSFTMDLISFSSLEENAGPASHIRMVSIFAGLPVPGVAIVSRLDLCPFALYDIPANSSQSLLLLRRLTERKEVPLHCLLSNTTWWSRDISSREAFHTLVILLVPTHFPSSLRSTTYSEISCSLSIPSVWATVFGSIVNTIAVTRSHTQ